MLFGVGLIISIIGVLKIERHLTLTMLGLEKFDSFTDDGKKVFLKKVCSKKLCKDHLNEIEMWIVLLCLLKETMNRTNFLKIILVSVQQRWVCSDRGILAGLIL